MISNISEVYCTVLVSYSGILFLYIRTCFIYQAALVVIYMVLYWSTFSLMFLIHFFLYAVCLLYRSQNQLVDEYFYRHAAVFTVIVETAICSLNRSLTLQGDISHCIYFWAQNNKLPFVFQHCGVQHLSLPRSLFLDIMQRPHPHPLLGQRCVTSKKRLRGRLATSMRNLIELAQHQNDDHRNADFWPVHRLGSALNFKVLQGIKVDESLTH